MTTYCHPSPVGNLLLSGSESGLFSVTLSTQKTEFLSVPPALARCVQQLDEYFAGNRRTFDLDLDWRDTPDFYQKVWLALLQIPYGTTTSYGALAQKVGNPKAARAVGLANGRNRIAIIVPCHRVIGSNGALTGYAHGLEMKKYLLQLENPVTQNTLF